MTSCTVIIPVGPGHEKLAEQALQSAMIAAEQKGAFERIHIIVGDDTKGEIGRSDARNRMARGISEQDAITGPESWMAVFTSSDEVTTVDAFQSEWLFFLDADDIMCSQKIMGPGAFEVVSPYLDDYDCIWGAIHELHPNGEVYRRKQVDRITTYEAYVKTPAFQSCQIGHFVRRSSFPGFDVKRDVCEDVDLYLREWKSLRCIKQEKPLFLNRRGAHSWTNRSGMPTGRDWSEEAERMLKQARKEKEA